jgi:hypothetical protein
MLGKLQKHEFRATARIMLPRFGILLALAILSNLSSRMLEATDALLLNILGNLVIVAFFVTMFAVCLMSFVIMIKRFHSNLLTDEGYLMFTLPVSVHSLVWSKIIVSLVWFIGTFLLVALSALIFSFHVSAMGTFFAQLADLFRMISKSITLGYAVIAAEASVMVLLGGVGLCLLFYASMAVGHAFTKHKILMSIGFFIAFQFVVQLIGTVAAALFQDFSFVTISPQNITSAWHTVFALWWPLRSSTARLSISLPSLRSKSGSISNKSIYNSRRGVYNIVRKRN